MKKFEREMVRGWLHEPKGDARGQGIVLTHGAGSNCESPLLTALAAEFCGAGFHVLRCDLPYRQQRPHGPPSPGGSARDREGLRQAVQAMREFAPGHVMLGGHSYGGRQSSMLAADAPEVAQMLLLLSYPLHTPRKPEQLRTAHLANIQTPALFIHGARDPFGSPAEMAAALELIPAHHHIVTMEKTGHELRPELAPVILRETLCFATALNK